MTKHLTDRQKKEIMASYVETGNYSAVGRQYSISSTAVRNIVMQNPENFKKLEEKKEQNTADILEFMNTKKKDVCEIIGLYLKYLQDKDKLNRTSIQSIATSLGIVIDKFTQGAEKKPDTEIFENIVKAAGGKFET